MDVEAKSPFCSRLLARAGACWVASQLLLVIISKVAYTAATDAAGCEIECYPVFPSSQSSCSLAFFCRYDTPLPPHVYVDGKLIDLPPSTPNKNVTFNPCRDTDRHCIVGSRNYGNVEVHMILINLSLPLLGCKSDIELKVQYHGPQSYGCSVTQSEKVSTMGCSICREPGEPQIASTENCPPVLADSSPWRSACIAVVVLLIVVFAIAFGAIALVMYLARRSLKMKCLSCKAYCHNEALQPDEGGVEDVDGSEQDHGRNDRDMCIWK